MVCEKCGAILVPGKNWYTNKGDHVCCDCSGYPVYRDVPAHNWDNDNDYEGAILARQEMED